MLTKQLACTALERGFAESEVQSLLVQQRALIQQALQKDALNTDLQVCSLIRMAMRLSCVVIVVITCTVVYSVRCQISPQRLYLIYT